MRSLPFFVLGVPTPKGSTRSFLHSKTKRIITRASNAEKLHPWEARITLAAQAAGIRPGFGQVDVTLVFVFARPKGHLGKRGVKPSAPAHHTQKPDLDKLVRAALDGLTGVAYADDSQVGSVIARKRWAEPGEQAGLSALVTQGWGTEVDG